MTRILGVDPGSRSTGFGIIEIMGSKLRHVASGRISVRGEDLPARLQHIFEALSGLIAAHEPQEFAVERVFVHRNAASALKLGHARGAALLAAVTRALPVYEYTPTQIKQSITGKGHAGKEQIQYMTRLLLSLPALPGSDAADALAVAVCHGHTRGTQLRVARAREGGWAGSARS